MRIAITVLLVTLLAAPALAGTLMTDDDTPILAKPDKDADVLATVPRNVRIEFTERDDNWYQVTAEVDGETVEGWVNRRTVTDTMGRSKGQLLAENGRLYDELVEPRAEIKRLEAELERARAELDAAREEIEELRSDEGAE